jgi:hypothetical protein
LVGDLRREVVPVDVAQVEALWQLFAGDVIRRRVVLGPLLRLLQRGRKGRVIRVTELLALLLSVDVSLRQLEIALLLLLLAVRAVLGMVLLEHADVGRPPEVVGIDKRDGFVVFLAGDVLGMRVVPLAEAATALERLGGSFDLRLQLQVDVRLRLQGNHFLWLVDLVLVRDNGDFDVVCVRLY